MTRDKTKPLCETTQGAPRQIFMRIYTGFLQKPGDKKSREDPTRRYNVEELLIKEIARYTECYNTDMVKLDTIIEGIRQQVMFMRIQAHLSDF